MRSGLGSRSREKGTVQTRDWAAGPYRLGRDVSILKFPAHITWDTRTRRGYVSRPYPRRIRIGYVSDTGYVGAMTYPCFRAENFRKIAASSANKLILSLSFLLQIGDSIPCSVLYSTLAAKGSNNRINSIGITGPLVGVLFCA